MRQHRCVANCFLRVCSDDPAGGRGGGVVLAFQS